MNICTGVCPSLKGKVSTHLSIFAVPGVNAVDLGHGPPPKGSGGASAHGKLPEEKHDGALAFFLYIPTGRK